MRLRRKTISTGELGTILVMSPASAQSVPGAAWEGKQIEGAGIESARRSRPEPIHDGEENVRRSGLSVPIGPF